jgi:hypothetical protein
MPWWALRTRPASCTQRPYFGRVWTASKTYWNLWAPKANAWGSLKVRREKRRWMGGEGLLEPKRVGGDTTCGEIGIWMGRETDGGDGAVETVSAGKLRAREPEGGTGEKETTYLGFSTEGTRCVHRSSGARIVH